VTPAELLGHDLAAARAQSAAASFDDEWSRAVARALGGVAGEDLEAWQDALGSTRPAWREAWERRPPTRAQRALHVVAGDDREALPDGYVGDCARCDAPIIITPGARRPGVPRLYCTDACRRSACAERHAAA